MIKGCDRAGLSRAAMTCGGLALLASLMWFALGATDLARLFETWAVPAAALLHLMEQIGCGYAWRNVVEPPRAGFWPFFHARWVRASVASLTPLSGVGGALAAVRVLALARIGTEIAVASLVLDSTVEMTTQVIFTALGFGILLFQLPQLSILGWASSSLAVALVAVGSFIAAQRFGAFRILQAAVSRLATHWPRMSSLSEARLHERLMSFYGRGTAVFGSGCIHLGCWLLGAGEIWLTLFALGIPTGLDKCLIVESLGMAARSAGFFVPGALGVQEVALVAVSGLVGLSLQSAMLVAIVKRLRDVVLGVPGLLLWQWLESRHLHLRRLALKQD